MIETTGRVEIFSNGTIYSFRSKYAKTIQNSIRMFEHNTSPIYNQRKDIEIKQQVFTLIDIGQFIYATIINNLSTIENVDKAKECIIDGNIEYVGDINDSRAIEYMVQNILNNKLEECCKEIENCKSRLSNIIKGE